MKPPRKYTSAAAFRVALENRLKRMAWDESLDLQRARRQAAFDRLLCRLFAGPDAPWLLKSGYALELRLKIARTTRDIDLALKRLPVPSGDWDANAPNVMEALREAGQLDLQDFFTFVFGDGEGMWHRGGHGEAFRRGRAILQHVESVKVTIERRVSRTGSLTSRKLPDFPGIGNARPRFEI